jgi:hypothetical protein
MQKKIVGILVMTLMIATAVIPAVGIMNDLKIYQKEITPFLQPTIEWEKSYPGDEFDQFRCVKQTEDGGYIAFGEYEESNMNYARMIKLDPEGNEEWTIINHDINGSAYGDAPEGELMNTVMQTTEGGYLAVGHYNYFYQVEEFDDFWGAAGFLWKVDSTGNTEWIKETYNLDPPTYIAPFHSVELDDGYISTGYITTFLNPELTESNTDVGLFKTDLEGNLLWYKTYDFGGYEGGQSLTQTSDGGYYITGACEQPNDNVEGVAMLMVKTDGEGNKLWDKIFDTPKDDISYLRGTCQADDGGYIISGPCGSLNERETDLTIIKTDSMGNKEWEKKYDRPGVEFTWCMDKTFDGGYVFALVTDYGKFGGNRDDSWIIKTDEDANAEWKLHIEQPGSQMPIHIDQTDDGGFIFSYRTGYADSRGTDSYLVKISAFENQRPSNPSTPTGPSRGKPDKEYTFSTTAVTDPEGDMIYYQWDWGDGNLSELLETTETTYTWSYEDNFGVRVIAIDEHGGQSEWSDPLVFSTPRNKITIPYNTIFWRLIERFPIIKSLL